MSSSPSFKRPSQSTNRGEIDGQEVFYLNQSVSIINLNPLTRVTIPLVQYPNESDAATRIVFISLPSLHKEKIMVNISQFEHVTVAGMTEEE